jgi:hypothetical protein
MIAAGASSAVTSARQAMAVSACGRDGVDDLSQRALVAADRDRSRTVAAERFERSLGQCRSWRPVTTTLCREMTWWRVYLYRLGTVPSQQAQP